jgi:hypothetical protein
VVTYQAFSKIAQEHRKLEQAIKLIDEQLETVNSQLKDMA